MEYRLVARGKTGKPGLETEPKRANQFNEDKVQQGTHLDQFHSLGSLGNQVNGVLFWVQESRKARAKFSLVVQDDIRAVRAQYMVEREGKASVVAEVQVLGRRTVQINIRI